MSKVEKAELVVVEVKLRRPHPANKMKIQSHEITNVFQKFKMTHSEVKELESKGGKHWFITKKEFDETVKPAAKVEVNREKPEEKSK